MCKISRNEGFFATGSNTGKSVEKRCDIRVLLIVFWDRIVSIYITYRMFWNKVFKEKIGMKFGLIHRLHCLNFDTDVGFFKVHINPPQFLVVCTEDAKRAGKLLYSFWFSPLVPEIFASKKPNFGLSARNCRECFQRFRAWEPGTIRFHTTRNT